MAPELEFHFLNIELSFLNCKHTSTYYANMERIITQLYRCLKYVNNSKLKYDLKFPEITNNITYDSNLSKYKTFLKQNKK